MVVSSKRKDRFNDALDKLISKAHKLTAKVDNIYQRKRGGQLRQKYYKDDYTTRNRSFGRERTLYRDRGRVRDEQFYRQKWTWTAR